MALELDAKAVRRVQEAEIGLVQGTRDWWEGSLRVRLG